MKKRNSLLMIIIGTLLFFGGVTGLIMTLRATLADNGLIAEFDIGQTVNDKMGNLAGQAWNIQALKRANTLPEDFTPSTANTVSSSTSQYPIYIYFDDTDGTMYYYSEAVDLYLNSDSSSMFSRMQTLTDISGLRDMNTSKVINAANMFHTCGSLSNISSLSNWDTSSITNMFGMFKYCLALDNLDALSGWDTSNVITMNTLFFNCTGLSDIDGISSWDTSKVTDMSGMFRICTALTNISVLSNWDTSNVTDMYNMFYGCSKASGTIQILGNPITYDYAFNGAATESGAQIIVNYGSGTTNIDDIIATKSTTSNVVKGQVVTPNYLIETSVTNGTITESTRVEKGGNLTVEYRPVTGFVLKSIKVDGENIDINAYPNSYSFTNVTEFHTIEVVYGEPSKIGYIVNYLEKGTNHVLHAQKADDEAIINTKITARKEVIDIDNYTCVEYSPEILVIGSTRDNNIINIYYRKIDNKKTDTKTDGNKIVSDRVNSPNTTTRNMFLYIIIMMISIVCFVLGIKNYKQIKS